MVDRYSSQANCASTELVFGVARIFASFNDTFVHITDLTFVLPRVATHVVGDAPRSCCRRAS